MKRIEKAKERIAANKSYLAKARVDALDAVGAFEALLTARGTRTEQLVHAAGEAHHATGRVRDFAQRLVDARAELKGAKGVRS